MNKLNNADIKKIIMDAPIAEYIGDSGAEIFSNKACGVLDINDGEYLFRKGDIENNLYILINGRLALVNEKGKDDENPDILHVLTKGDLVGELSFIDDTPHIASAMSLGNSSVLQFNADDMRPLINEHPQLMFDFMRAIIKRVHHTVSDLGRQQVALSNYIYNSGKKGI